MQRGLPAYRISDPVVVSIEKVLIAGRAAYTVLVTVGMSQDPDEELILLATSQTGYHRLRVVLYGPVHVCATDAGLWECAEAEEVAAEDLVKLPLWHTGPRRVACQMRFSCRHAC
jgi:hypothetical protein